MHFLIYSLVKFCNAVDDTAPKLIETTIGAPLLLKVNSLAFNAAISLVNVA